ncbi:MAG: 30S ribosome-binding factor RbfA [Thermomicrobiales bacterium]
MTRRTRQVGEMLREELSDIIRREVKDPRIGFMSITSVDVPPDLRSARVYISVLGTDQERSDTLDALRSAAKFIRFHLKPRLRMRQIPDLDFRDDRSMEYAQQISATLREIKATDGTKKVEESTLDGVVDSGSESGATA